VVASAVSITSAQDGDPQRLQQLQREQRLREMDQFDLDTRIKANEMVPVDQRLYVDAGGFLSLNYLFVEDGDGKTRGGRIYEAVAYARANLDGVQEAFIRTRYAYFNYFSESDSFDGRGSGWNPDKLDRAYYRFDVGRYMQAYEGKNPEGGLAIQAGRDLVYWANGLTLGARLDGFIIDGSYGNLGVQGIAGVTPNSTVDFDASRPDYDSDTRRGFFGVLFTYDIGQHQPFFYALVQRDWNDNDPVDQNLGFTADFDPDTGAVIPGSEQPILSRFGYNSQYFGFGSSGALSERLLYSVEAVYQTGSARPTNVRPEGASIALAGDGNQHEEMIQAGAFNGRIEYLFLDTRQTRLSFEQTLASGDGDRISTSTDTIFGNQPGTRDHAFNGFGLINSGLAFSPNLANLSITRVGIVTNPIPHGAGRRLQIGLDVLVYAKLRSNAVIDEPTDDDNYLGIEPDLLLTWQITSDLTLVARYGYFIPSNAFPDGDDENRQFFFAGVTYAF
jgi:hypothetical protein